MKHFKDKVAVVTGGASGIGRGMAEIFIEAGMQVVLADVEEEKLQAVVANLKDSGADVLGVTTDVSKPDQVKKLAEKTMETFGAVHVLCNNAGVGYRTADEIRSCQGKSGPLRATKGVYGYIAEIDQLISCSRIGYCWKLVYKKGVNPNNKEPENHERRNISKTGRSS